jgi:aspartokinase
MAKLLRVMKFGGTSMGDAECIARSAKIVVEGAREASVVVVVSAMSGVTNRLIASATRAASGDAGSTKPRCKCSSLTTQRAVRCKNRSR